MTVHNHGTEEGKGLACRESVVNGELKGECMTDDLRTRIVSALARADQDWCSDNPLYEDMADIVIRELGLRQERQQCESVGGGHSQWHRYVTDWVLLADDTAGDVNHA